VQQVVDSKEDALARDGCAAADYRLSGALADRFCSLHLMRENPPEYALRLLEVLDRRPPRTRFEDVTIRAVDHTYRA
jgi:hypothetical protein